MRITVPRRARGRTLSMDGGMVVTSRPVPASVVLDGFNRADSAVTLGTADTGQTWTAGNAGDVAALPGWGISGNRAYLATSGNAAPDKHAWLETGAANCTITVTVTVPTAAANRLAGILLRRVDANNYMALRINPNAQLVSLLRNLATVRSTTAQAAFVVADGQTVVLTVTLVGSQITAYCDGVRIWTFSDANFATATKHGLFQSDTAAGCFLDEFNVRAAS